MPRIILLPNQQQYPMTFFHAYKTTQLLKWKISELPFPNLLEATTGNVILSWTIVTEKKLSIGLIEKCFPLTQKEKSGDILVSNFCYCCIITWYLERCILHLWIFFFVSLLEQSRKMETYGSLVISLFC